MSPSFRDFTSPNKVARASPLAGGPAPQARGMLYLTALVALASAVSAFAQPKSEPAGSNTGSNLLWKKLETHIEQIADRFDGVMGLAILDLTDGRRLLHNGDRPFPTASSIKSAILLELYRQDQETRAGAKGKAKLDDIYTLDPKDLVEEARSWLVSLRV
jgi:beta-lactamase class A